MTGRMLAVDLDGTLLRSDLTVSPRDRAAVARCLDLGIRVVIATGRVFESALPYARLWPGQTLWIAACNGAVIRPSDGGPPLQEKAIPLPLARQVAAWAQEEGLYLKAYVDDLMLISRETAETPRFAAAHRVRYAAVGDLAAHLARGPTKLALIDEPRVVASLVPGVQERWGGRLEIALSAPDCLELTPRGVTKGAALAALARHFAIPPSQAAAIGNEQNDLSMITWAGFGGAVAGAPPAVRAAADLVVADHDANGVAEFIAAWLGTKQVQQP